VTVKYRRPHPGAVGGTGMELEPARLGIAWAKAASTPSACLPISILFMRRRVQRSSRTAFWLRASKQNFSIDAEQGQERFYVESTWQEHLCFEIQKVEFIIKAFYFFKIGLYYTQHQETGTMRKSEVSTMTPKHLFITMSAWLLAVALAACSTVPVTGRQQLDLVPAGQVMAMSATEYRKFMAGHEVVTGTEESRSVKRVGERIRDAVEKYFADRNMAGLLQGYHWEFNLVKDSSVNAWAMPGGKVAVYTGILPVARNDTGLATVMGHEIAHAVARHGNERMSQALLAQLGGMALDAALARNPSQTRDLFMTAYGLGAQVGVLLPYSRLQESEADHLGLIFMAMAGYDPRKALDFWRRMAAQAKGGAPPEFLSTHPAHETRMEQIKEDYLPEAMTYYRPKGGSGE